MSLEGQRVSLPRAIGPQVAVRADPRLLKRLRDLVATGSRLVGEPRDEHGECRAVVIALVRARHWYRLPA